MQNSPLQPLNGPPAKSCARAKPDLSLSQSWRRQSVTGKGDDATTAAYSWASADRREGSMTGSAVVSSAGGVRPAPPRHRHVDPADRSM